MTAPTSIEVPGIVRRMRWWDIPAAAALERLLFAEDSPWTEAMFWAELAAGHDYQVVTDEAGVLLGYAGLAIGLDDADVQTIGVSPRVQGRGIGRVLLRLLLDAAGTRPVHLEVRTDNAAAIALYESERFVRLGVRRRYYRPSGADAYTMVRTGSGPVAPGPSAHR